MRLVIGGSRWEMGLAFGDPFEIVGVGDEYIIRLRGLTAEELRRQI